MSTAFRTIPTAALQKPQEFTVSVPEEKLAEFRQLLELSRVGRPTYEGQQQDRKWGITTEWLKSAKEQWMSFDWRKVEDKINSFPNYKMQISDEGTEFDIHFVAIFSERKDAVPLMMLHGWPGSFLEFLAIAKSLMTTYTPATLPYHLVVPSLPGYAFSSPPPLDREFTSHDVARVLNRLMAQLGFGAGYVVQGGDLGAKIARVLGVSHPEAKAVHLNFCLMADPGTAAEGERLTAAEKAGLARGAEFVRTGSAYALEHATRPSTVGLALSASPLALLAWVGETFLDWSDAAPALATVLESATLYWLTDCFASTIYPYRERFTMGSAGWPGSPDWYIRRPLGFSSFPREIAPVPRAWVAQTGDLVFFRQHDAGGHFAALERPEALLRDVEEFIAQVWPVE